MPEAWKVLGFGGEACRTCRMKLEASKTGYSAMCQPMNAISHPAKPKGIGFLLRSEA